MKGLVICVLATMWVLEVIYLRPRRRHLHERPDHIDRDFRDLVRRMRAEECPTHGPNCTRRVDKGVTHHTGAVVHGGPPVQGRGPDMCPVHGWQCWGGHNGARTN